MGIKLTSFESEEQQSVPPCCEISPHLDIAIGVQFQTFLAKPPVKDDNRRWRKQYMHKFCAKLDATTIVTMVNDNF